MEYTKEYQLSRDIDWFFQFNGIFFHVASNGYVLPRLSETQQNKVPFFVDQENNAIVQIKTTKMMNDKNNRYNIVVRPNPNNLNYSTFIEYARMGFVSLDTIGVNNFIVIARPQKYNNIEIPDDIDKDIKPLNVVLAKFQIADINGIPLKLN